MPLRTVFAALLAGLSFAPAAWAQDQAPALQQTPLQAPAPQPVPLQAPAAQASPTLGFGTAAVPPAEKVDESALRYYARNNELERVEAEIRRLQTLHPTWTAPDDLFSAQPRGSDEQAFWDLFAADRMDDLEALIVERQTTEAGWRPSADLATKIAYKRARQRLVNASDAGQTGKVLEIAATEGFVMGCADIDVLWRVAAAHAGEETPDQAVALYRRILTECTNAGERLATVQKALGVLPPSLVIPLLALGHTNADGTGEFDVVRPDIFRARLGAIAGGDKTEIIDPAELAAFEARAEADAANIDDAGLLGWFYYGQEKWEPAYSWFQKALDRGGQVKVAEGAVLTLRALEKPVEAEALAAEWSDRSTEVQALFLGLGAARLTMDPPPDLDATYVERYSKAVDTVESGDGAQAMGWYAYNKGKPAEARAWFEKGMQWDARDSTALGLVLSLQRLGERKKLAELIAEYSPDYPSVKGFGESLAQATKRGGTGSGGGDGAAAALRDGNYQKCLTILGRRSKLSAADSLMQGWCLMGASRPREAANAFDAALAGTGKTRDDAAYGKSLALLRSGLSAPAVQAAAEGNLSSERRNEIGTAALGQQAADLFRAGRYREVLGVLDRRAGFTSEPRSLAMLRGWSFYHLRRLGDARQVFAQLDQQLSTKESRQGLGAVGNALLPRSTR